MDGNSRPSALLEVFGRIPIQECVARAAISRNRTEAFQTGLTVLISSWVTGDLEPEAKAAVRWRWHSNGVQHQRSCVTRSLGLGVNALDEMRDAIGQVN